MGLCKEDVTLFLEDNLKITNISETGNFTCKLSDFFCNQACFDFGTITILEICNSKINEIPNSIKRLQLKQLMLSNNKFVEVPSCLYTSLEALELLDLSRNQIKSFEIEPACASTIVTLRLSHNCIKNFPKWILSGRCLNLQEVDYSANMIISFSTTHSLLIKKLELRNTQLIDEDFTFLKSIKSLEYLDVGNDKISQWENYFKDINQLFTNYKWVNIRVLKLNNLMLSIVPSGIFWLTSLTELHLVNCDLNWIPEEIKYLTNLEVLDIADNGICSLPSYLTVLNQLKIVKASNNSISTVDDFASKLEILDLYSNQIESFPSIDEVRFVDLEQNIISTSLLDNYTTKRDQFRQTFAFVSRIDGPIELVETSGKESASCDSSSDDSIHEYSDVVDVVEECWDDEKSIKTIIFKNPEVTPSDDEWDGKIEIRNKKKSSIFLLVDENEDWIFCDVEEL